MKDPGLAGNLMASQPTFFPKNVFLTINSRPYDQGLMNTYEHHYGFPSYLPVEILNTIIKLRFGVSLFLRWV